MDTMADTSCAGANWIMIEDTGFVCDVYPFKDGYEAVKMSASQHALLWWKATAGQISY